VSAPRVGKISYLNTAPFFYQWPAKKFPVAPGVPRALADDARAGKISAAPLPIVECWDLEDTFKSLGPWGIAAKKECRSVLVFSRRPFSQLNNTTIGLTLESSTSVVLCDVLIRQRYNHAVRLRRGLEANDEAWLVIGDQALKFLESGHKTWPYVTDLATEWWNWQKLPFVFARWVVKKNEPALETELSAALHASLTAGKRSLSAIAQKEAIRLRLPGAKILSYLNVFDYVLDDKAEEAIALFRDFAKERTPELVGTDA
jgi:chorismate dehydratase